MAHLCLRAKCPNRVSLGSASDEGSIDLMCSRCGRSYYRSPRGKTIGVVGLFLIGMFSIVFLGKPLIVNAIKIVKEMVYPSLSDSQLWLQDFEEKFNAVVSTDGDTIMDMRYTSFKEGFKAKIDARKGPTDSIDFAERTQLELELQELRDTLETYRFK